MITISFPSVRCLIPRRPAPGLSWKAPGLLVALALVIALPACAATFTDDFNDPSLKPIWEPYIPLAGPAITSNGSQLHVSLPADRAYNQATSTDDAPQVRLNAPDGDFTAETRLSLDGSPTGSFEAGLALTFGKSDAYVIGRYQNGTQLRVERRNTQRILKPVPAGPLDLQIRKAGTRYTFSYRAGTTGSWTPLFSDTVTDKPLTVGVLLRSWQGIAVGASFDRFSLSGAGVPSLDFTTLGWVKGLTHHGADPINGPWLLVRTPDGKQVAGVAKAAASGVAGLFNVPPGTYTVKAVHPWIDSGPEQTVTVTAGHEAVADLEVFPCPNINLASNSRDFSQYGATGWNLLPGPLGSSNGNAYRLYRAPYTDDYTPVGVDPTFGTTWRPNATVPYDYGANGRVIPDNSIFWYRVDLQFPDTYHRFMDRSWFLSGFNVDDEDNTSVNAVTVGQTNFRLYPDSWKIIREYPVPGNILRAPGKNVLAIQGFEGGGGAGITNSAPRFFTAANSVSDITVNVQDRAELLAENVSVTLTSLGGAYTVQGATTEDGHGAFFRWLPEGEYTVQFDRGYAMDPSRPQRLIVPPGKTGVIRVYLAPSLPHLDLRSDQLEVKEMSGWTFMAITAAQTPKADADTAPAQRAYPDTQQDATYGEDWFYDTPVPANLGASGDTTNPASQPIQDNSVFWYRIHLPIPTDWKTRYPNRDLFLSQFKVDDKDTTWFNGTLIGSTDGADKTRSYVIPRALVKWDEDNVIAIRGRQGVGGAGLTQDPKMPFTLAMQPLLMLPPMNGDADGNGIVNVLDVTLALQFAAKLSEPTPAQLASLDLDGNGRVDVSDVVRILKSIVGLDPL